MAKKDYKWYVLYLKTNHEKSVSAYFDRTQIDHYLPTRECIRTWSDRIKKIKVPLFPGYIFIHCSYQELIPILKHSSIINYVCYCGKPAVLSDDQIKTIMKLEEEQFIYSLESQRPAKNNLVEVLAGPLKGLTGKISMVNKNHFILMDLRELNQSIRIKIDRKYVAICQ